MTQKFAPGQPFNIVSAAPSDIQIPNDGDGAEDPDMTGQAATEIQLMPSSNERPRRKSKVSKSYSNGGAGGNHHRKMSSNNAFEDIKGALRDELLSIDFNHEDGAEIKQHF